MKKLVAAAIVSCILLGSGAVFAQTSQSHGVSVTIPQLLMIRIVDGVSNAETEFPDAVEFELAALTFVSEEPIEPTSVDLNWSDIRVFTNLGGWDVYVETVDGSTDFAWGKITVTPTNADYEAFTLPMQGVTDRIIASSTGSTTGWHSLGIGPSSYVLRLTGDEAPAEYSTTVRYTIMSNP